MVAGAASLCACEPAAQKVGQLVVAIATDRALPQQIDTIQVQVEVHGQVIHTKAYSVGAGNDPVPATLTLLAGNDPAEAATIRVFGGKSNLWRTYRDAVTTVPADRIALLRMPVQWLCDGTAKTVSAPDGMGGTVTRTLSTCDDGNTCVAGHCVPNMIDSATLPDYTPEAVFGGAADPKQGRCFDTVPCMVKGTPAEPDDHCSIPKPAGELLNVALRVATDGICDSTTTVCFVPLDGSSNEGWTLTAAGDRLVLPQAVCEKLATHLVHAVYVSTACETKTEAIPPCGEWSSVPSAHPIEPPKDGTPDVPVAAVIASLLPSNQSAKLCCPLMQDAGKLYTCVCTSSPADTTIVAIDPTVSGSQQIVGELKNRQLSGLAVSVFGGALYWLDRNPDGSLNGNAVQRTMLTGTQATATSLPLDAAPFGEASLLADAAGVYLLANVPAVEASPVQFLKLDPKAGVSTHFDTGGNKVVFQFDQDADAVYVARDTDAAAGGGTLRQSAVVRIAKADGHASTMLPDSALMITDTKHGGYVRVRIDDTRLIALFEGAPAPDGKVSIQVRRTAIANAAASGTSDTLFSMPVDPALAQIGLQGALDGAVVLSRIDYDPTVSRATAVATASLFVVPAAGGVPRILADYSGDFPSEGFASDASYIYWLNNSGKLYRLSRAALR
jgi:hypothetical protein